jgi:hypothetical protein
MQDWEITEYAQKAQKFGMEICFPSRPEAQERRQKRAVYFNQVALAPEKV